MSAENTERLQRLASAAPVLLLALKDLLEQLDGIGIPDWHGAEGLCLQRAKSAVAQGEWASDEVSGFMAAVRHDIQLNKEERKKAEGGAK
jgi:hypothetical protein